MTKSVGDSQRLEGGMRYGGKRAGSGAEGDFNLGVTEGSWTRWHLMGHEGGEAPWVGEEAPQLSRDEAPERAGPHEGPADVGSEHEDT